VANFESYYWAVGDLPAEDATWAKTLIESDRIDDAKRAFAQLLESNEVAARGVALDHYVYAETQGRFGVSNPFSIFDKAAISSARQLLQGPPVTAKSPRGSIVVGANHASALGVLMHLGDSSDLQRIEPFLDPSRDLNVLEEACMAAERCVRTADSDSTQRIGARLAALFQNDKLNDEVRVFAIRPFRRNPLLDQEEVLLETLTRGSMPVSAYAAWILLARDRAKYEEVLRAALATWPADAPYPAGEVRSRMK
jgi:hypothetical protein